MKWMSELNEVATFTNKTISLKDSGRLAFASIHILDVGQNSIIITTVEILRCQNGTWIPPPYPGIQIEEISLIEAAPGALTSKQKSSLTVNPREGKGTNGIWSLFSHWSTPRACMWRQDEHTVYTGNRCLVSKN